MVEKLTRGRRKGKAKRKSPRSQDFPLWKHPSGRWCHKVKKRFWYFGRVSEDPEGKAALDLWLYQKDDILTGRRPRKPGEPERRAIGDLCNRFLAHKTTLLNAGELSPRTFQRYHGTCADIVRTLGKHTAVDDLRPEDFGRLRTALSAKWGPVGLGNEIQTCRSVFKFGYETGLVDKPPRYGPEFKKPSASVLRKQRATKGDRTFVPGDILALLEHAGPNMKAMVLLGIQAGLGNTDLALLPAAAVNLTTGWLDYPQPKTGVPRRIPLWPETIEAIEAAVAARRDPKDESESGLLFIGPRGESYVGNHRGYRIGQEFDRVADKGDVRGKTFYDLRRTFQAVAEGAKDLSAVQSIMGQAASSSDMSAIYRRHVDDDRLRAVVDHVHRWLYAEIETRQKSPHKTRAHNLKIIG